MRIITATHAGPVVAPISTNNDGTIYVSGQGTHSLHHIGFVVVVVPKV